MELQEFLKQRTTMTTIKRFSMVKVLHPQSLSCHGYNVGSLFCLLCDHFGVDIKAVELFMVMQHDFVESYTGDLNAHIKDQNEETKHAWRVLEESTVPNSLHPYTEKGLENILKGVKDLLFRLADQMDAYLFCKDERKMGNTFIDGPLFRYKVRITNTVHDLNTYLLSREYREEVMPVNPNWLDSKCKEVLDLIFEEGVEVHV